MLEVCRNQSRTQRQMSQGQAGTQLCTACTVIHLITEHKACVLLHPSSSILLARWPLWSKYDTTRGWLFPLCSTLLCHRQDHVKAAGSRLPVSLCERCKKREEETGETVNSFQHLSQQRDKERKVVEEIISKFRWQEGSKLTRRMILLSQVTLPLIV